MQIDVKRFMELRDGAIARQGGVAAKSSDKADWRALLDSKRKEIGLEPAASTAATAAKKSAATVRTVAADFDGTMEERVSALRERSAEGLPVRELGNFIDVRA